MRIVVHSVTVSALLIASVLLVLGCAAPAPTPTVTPRAAAAAPTPAKASATPTPGLPSFKAGSIMDKIQKRGKLIVGVRYDVLRLGYLDPQTNKVEGFEVDLAKELAKAILGAPEKVEITQVTAKSRIPLLQSGEVDLVIANFTIDEERKKEVDFGKSHLSLSYWMVVLKDSTYQKLSDLDGKSIANVTGAEVVAEAMRARLPKAEIVNFATHPEMALAVSTKRVDAYQGSDFPTLDALEKNPNLRRFRVDLGKPNDVAAGFRKGEEDFVGFWNQLLDNLASTGRLKELFLKSMPSGMDLKALPFDVK